MAEILLITKENIDYYEYISEQMQTKRLEAYMRSTQRLTLRELLGRPLYRDLFENVTDIDTIDAPYDALVNGEEYEIISGEPIKFYGLKPFLCHSTLCVILARNNFRITDYGNMGFSNDPQSYLNKSSKTDKNDAAESFRMSAIDYRNDIVDYLNEKYSDFPLWNGGNNLPKRTQLYSKQTLS